MREPVTAYIGLGANLGDACAAVLQAMRDIADIDAVVLTRQSSLYSSAPVDANGPDYINAVVQVLSQLPALALLACLQTIELGAGRQRPFRNAPRTLDLDILLFGTQRLSTPELTLPHPRMAQRAFVLLPLAEIEPSLVTRHDLQRVANQSIRRLD